MLVSSSTHGRMATLGWEINGVDMGERGCDGVVVATAVGSTGYNLSAGGPIMGWGVDAMVLDVRRPARARRAAALVLSHSHRIRITSHSIGFSSRVVVDGHVVGSLDEDAVAEIRLGLSTATAGDAARPPVPGPLPRDVRPLMLERLVVSNLVVIRDADLQLGPGLNGADRRDRRGQDDRHRRARPGARRPHRSSLVGPNGPEAYVEAAFALPPGMLAREAFDGVRELAGEEDEPLILARRVTADGRGRALACGRATTRAALAAAGEELVSVVSQHEARALTRPAVQRTLLDGFAGPEQVDRLQAMADAWHGLAEARRALAAAESDAAGADRLIDDLGDLVRRVDAVAPEPGESERLRAERERLRHADALLQAAGGAAHLLEPTDGDGAVTSVGLAERALAAAEGFDPELGTIGAELRDALVRLEEVARSLHGYAAGVESDPARLEQLEGRLELLDDLARRHGSVEGALQAADEARDRLDRLGRRDTELVRLREAETAAVAVRKVADDLSTARRTAGAKFARAIERQLADLGMADARVDVRVEAREPGVNGADEVRLLVAPNPGGTWGSVAETASGGELSRISLAIRVAAQERSGVPMLVFDEVDAGVGGRTARAVGEKLAALSQTAQVICITHLAQVAALADHHFRVVKEPGDPTVTRVEKLEGDAVDVELARMLGGEEDSEEALQLARALRT